MAGYQPPHRSRIEALAAAHHLELNEDDLAVIQSFIEKSVGLYERLDHLPDPSPSQPLGDRETGYTPDEEEDPFNAYVTKCHVTGSGSGPLAGFDIALKDNIAVAGVPMTAGSTLLDGYVPRRDATVATRLLEAGGAIVGKTNQSALSFFGHPDWGPVRNPHDPERTAGGSSSGSAVAVVTGDVDVALGCDQGGSIRSPAAWTGCVGLKPTWGLVPYDGIMGIEDTIDHVGPMTRTVEDAARVLEVIAGYGPADPRQRESEIRTHDYRAVLATEAGGLTVGVLEEAVSRDVIEAPVQACVDAAVETLEDLGAIVERVSIPEATDGELLWTAIMTEGLATKFRAEGLTHFTRRPMDRQFAIEFGRARRTNAADFPLSVKANLVLGEYLSADYGSRYYAKARNLAGELTAAYEEVFESVDVLAMPTRASIAPPIGERYTRARVIERLSNKGETDAIRSQFDLTGHPAMSVPCGTVEGMPVGLQLVGALYDEPSIFRAASAVEAAVA